MTAQPRSRRPSPRAGRPTRAEAEARQAELLDVALDEFLARGFQQTTVEQIATAVGMTKRTIYARYASKEALFLASIRRAIDGLAVPEERIRATETRDLEATLLALARLRIDAVTTADGLRLQRIIAMESYRFPEIFGRSYARGAKPVVDFIAELFEERTRTGELAIEDPTLAANLFMSMVVGGPVRSFVSAIPLSKRAIDRRLRASIRLFLDGARRR